MPPVLLLIAILLLIAVAANSIVSSIGDLRLAGLERALDGEEPHLPEELEGDAPHVWIHHRLMDAYACETDGWAVEQVRRVEARLQADVLAEERLETVILWINEPTAFVMPGRHVYISRVLLERAGSDEQVAMILAHEMAHHRLGHVATLADRLERLPEPARGVAANWMIARAFVLHGADREHEADAHGFNLCLAAGYLAHHCLRAFDLLERLSLDYGDTEGVFGPDALIQAELDGEPEWMALAARLAVRAPPRLPLRPRPQAISAGGLRRRGRTAGCRPGVIHRHPLRTKILTPPPVAAPRMAS